MNDPVHIGDATLYHADCMDVLPTLEGVDCVVTDPPYGVRSDSWDNMDEHNVGKLVRRVMLSKALSL